MYTIKSTSEDGIFYLIKDWRKNKAILTKLLKVMEEYRTDNFELVKIGD